MSSITFSVEKMFRLPGAGGLKAFVDVGINESIVIKGVRVLQGKKGLFISMPQEQGKDKKWYNQVVCKTDSIFTDLAETVLEHYKTSEK